LFEVCKQAAHLVQLRPELLHPPELRGDLRQRAGGVLIQAPDAPLARLELPADGEGPCFGLLFERAQLGLGRGSLVEHLAEPFDQGEVERLWHLGGRAILSDALPARLPASVTRRAGAALQSLEGLDECERRGVPPLAQGTNLRFFRGIRPTCALEGGPRLTLLPGGDRHGMFSLFAGLVHLVQADPPEARNLRE